MSISTRKRKKMRGKKRKITVRNNMKSQTGGSAIGTFAAFSAIGMTFATGYPLFFLWVLQKLLLKKSKLGKLGKGNIKEIHKIMGCALNFDRYVKDVKRFENNEINKIRTKINALKNKMSISLGDNDKGVSLPKPAKDEDKYPRIEGTPKRLPSDIMELIRDLKEQILKGAKLLEKAQLCFLIETGRREYDDFDEDDNEGKDEFKHIISKLNKEFTNNWEKKVKIVGSSILTPYYQSVSTKLRDLMLELYAIIFSIKGAWLIKNKAVFNKLLYPTDVDTFNERGIIFVMVKKVHSFFTKKENNIEYWVLNDEFKEDFEKEVSNRIKTKLERFPGYSDNETDSMQTFLKVQHEKLKDILNGGSNKSQSIDTTSPKKPETETPTNL